MLQMHQVNTFYGVSHILFDVTMEVQDGSITGLLGRNGAGKTTTLRTIMGLTPPKSGRISFKGEEIAGMPAHKIASKGIAYVPDDRQIFSPLSVYENLTIGMPRSKKRRPLRWTLERIYDLFPVLRGLAAKRGAHISGGEQKMLAIGRALMQDPDLLLLDEPTEGLAPLIVKSLGDTILEIGKEGVTILLADQNVRFARKLIGYGYIIDKGNVEHHAPMEDIWNDKELVCKYLAV
ncbi:MAG: ABC transporter ATP-binding protein [Deltaproteobacteria bacterium]|nr:MAG: ABC transporter ATP-binding protein [Deltaproteobacteria bacterium]